MQNFSFQYTRVHVIAALTFMLIVPTGLPAQEELPDTPVLAARLAIPETRTQTLLELAVILRYQQRVIMGEGSLAPESMLQDLAWLDRLQTHIGPVRARSGVLDPAAWQMNQKLVQQGLPVGNWLAPDGPSLEATLHTVFQRQDERLAASVLPELLWRLEAESTVRWSALQQQAASDEKLRNALVTRVQPWLENAELELAPAVDAEQREVTEMMSALAEDAVSTGPPDPRRLFVVRSLLLERLPGLSADEARDATAYLRLASLIDGLHEQHYTAFVEGLLAVVASLLPADEEQVSSVAVWLTGHLPALSEAYARRFAAVDPRINSALASAYDVALNRAAGPPASPAAPLVAELADAVAQLALLVPDIEYYFDLPVRDTIAGSIETCIGMMARSGEEGHPAITRELFDDCQSSLVRLAETEAVAPGLAGDPSGPFGPAQLQREVSVTSMQRINYGMGYLHERYSTACSPPASPLPNPLEWSMLASLLTWLAEQSPVYFQTEANEARLVRMQAIGLELLATLSSQVDCFSGSGASLNDPVSRSLADYRAALTGLRNSLGESIQAFRDQALAPGSDIALELDGAQETTYRPDDLMIGPCDVEQACEMTGSLSTTRALLGLFPETYLVADQSGMGEVQLCYEHMEWVDRRAEPVRPDDTNVANYHGRFAFDLKGRFVVDGQASDVFGFRFTSPDEYHYLFAAAKEEVLSDSCPMEWVGSRIVTPMKNRRGGVVPNRLTYLAAPRMLPSRLLSLNWDRGAEWRDWFITGLGVEPLGPVTPPDIGPSVTEHLQSLYRQEQVSVYQGLMHGGAEGSAAAAYQQLQDLSTQKGLIRMLAMLFYPQSLLDSDAVRSAVAGQAGLLDENVLARFRQDNVPVNSISETGLRRLESLQAAWREQPEARLRTGSVAIGLAHALMRLDQVYRTYFLAAPETPETGDPSEAPETLETPALQELTEPSASVSESG